MMIFRFCAVDHFALAAKLEINPRTGKRVVLLLQPDGTVTKQFATPQYGG